MTLFNDFEDDLIDEPEISDNGLPAPRQMAESLGHSDIEKTLLALSESDRMPHALVFAGPEGLGKATMAFRLARYLLKHGRTEEEKSAGLFGDSLPADQVEDLYVSESDPVFRQVASGGHPDLLTIERLFDEKKGRYKGSVEVNEIRRIAPFLRLTASQGGWRIVIIDDADTMNRNSQNALLKILEEPPRYVLLILVAHRPGLLIPTIRSRCRMIPFQPLERDIFAPLMRREQASLPESEIDVLYALSKGSVGRALQIFQEGGVDAVAKVTGLLQSWPEWAWPEIHLLAENLARAGQEEGLQAFQDVLLWVVESLLQARARGVALPVPLQREAIENMMAGYSLEELIEICENLKTHFETVNYANLDKRQAVLGAFSVFNDVRESAKYG